MIAVDHDYAFESTWQLQIVQEDITRVVVPFADIAISIAIVSRAPPHQLSFTASAIRESSEGLR